MDRNILNVLLEYKKLEGTKKEFLLSLNESNDLSGFGVNEKQQGIIQNLEKSFLNNTKKLFEFVGKQGCQTTVIRGLDKKATKLDNGENSPHFDGRAVDVTFTDRECYCLIMDECAKYSNLYCQDLRTKGNVVDWPGPHIHVSDSKGNSSKTVPCTSVNKQSNTNYDTGGLEVDTGVYDFADQIAPLLGYKKKTPDNQQQQESRSVVGVSRKKILTENLSFGKSVKGSGSQFTIPADSNKKLYSPIAGTIVSFYDPGCENSLVLMSEDNSYYLQYCNLETKSVDKGDEVSAGMLLGKLGDEDVICNVLNSKKRKTSLDSLQNKKDDDLLVPPITNTSGSSSKSGSANYSPDEYRKQYDYDSFGDPGAVDYIDLLLYPFSNRYDKSGKLVTKNWGSPTDKRQPDKFKVIDKITSLSPKNPVPGKGSSDGAFTIPSWVKNIVMGKKVTENVDRIKKLLN